MSSVAKIATPLIRNDPFKGDQVEYFCKQQRNQIKQRKTRRPRKDNISNEKVTQVYAVRSIEEGQRLLLKN